MSCLPPTLGPLRCKANRSAEGAIVTILHTTKTIRKPWKKNLQKVISIGIYSRNYEDEEKERKRTVKSRHK